MDEDEEMAYEEVEDEDEARGIMGRVKGDLFDSDDEEDREDQGTCQSPFSTISV